jgi:hypothetical protein
LAEEVVVGQVADDLEAEVQSQFFYQCPEAPLVEVLGVFQVFLCSCLRSFKQVFSDRNYTLIKIRVVNNGYGEQGFSRNK